LRNSAAITETTLAIAKIIFFRVVSQITGQRIDDALWLEGLAGYKREPELFPFAEACVDAAMEIERNGLAEYRPD
jgi:hypothetical protein